MRRPTPVGIEAVEELLQRGERLVGLDGDDGVARGDLVAVADDLIALLVRREQLDASLADERLGHDGGLDVGGHRDVVVDGHGHLDLIAHDLDVGDLAGREAEHLDRTLLVQRDGAGEVGDDVVGAAAADERAGAGQAGQHRADGDDAQSGGHEPSPRRMA